MLRKFSVRNFRNFKDWFEYDFKTTKSYEFNTDVVENNIVKHSVIYGHNGNGKSNLGLALLDITCHMTDATILNSLKINYLNAQIKEELAEFQYEFFINDMLVVYEYGKQECDKPVYEKLTIDNKEVVKIDRRVSNIASYNFDGTDSLKNDFTKRAISAVKFVSANALLSNDEISKTFFKFIEFIEGMIFFRTLSRTKDYLGQPVDTNRISKSIIDQKKLNDFEIFLNESGIECTLKMAGGTGEEVIEFVFEKNSIEFSQVASTGTMSLGIFYYWYLKLLSGDIKFAYIDEFDAYYHFELSEKIVKLISKLDCQTIITTHNVSLMSNYLLRPDCYFLINKENITPLYKLSDREIRKAHNLEKMYRSGVFDE